MRILRITPVDFGVNLTYLVAILVDHNLARGRHHIINGLTAIGEIEHNLAKRSHGAAIGRRCDNAVLNNGSNIVRDSESAVGVAGEIAAVIPSLVAKEALGELEVI